MAQVTGIAIEKGYWNGSAIQLDGVLSDNFVGIAAALTVDRGAGSPWLLEQVYAYSKTGGVWARGVGTFTLTGVITTFAFTAYDYSSSGAGVAPAAWPSGVEIIVQPVIEAAAATQYHTQRLVMGSLHALSAYGSIEKLNMDTLDTDAAFQDDTLATADTTENEFVIKVAGDYEVNGMVNIDCNNTTGYYGGSYVYVNDVSTLGIFRAYKLSAGRILSCQGDLPGLAVDDVVDLRGYVQSGNSRKNFQAGTNFWLTLKAEA